MSIYVHESNGIDFNTVVYCLIRPYHLPTLDGQELPLVDTWFIVPAVRLGPTLSLVNSNIEISALTVIDEDGRTVKGSRINPNIAPSLNDHEIAKIKKEAFDIPLWEKTNQRSFPYDSMFDKAAMKTRLDASGLTRQDILSQTSTNIVYNEIRTKVRGRPCTTCGKGKTK